jgi:hypothetical protein
MTKKPHCLIDVEVAAALSKLLDRAGRKKPNKPIFFCRKCEKQVEPHFGDNNQGYHIGHHFEHSDKNSECKGESLKANRKRVVR